MSVDFTKELDVAARIKDHGERAVAIAAIVAEALRVIGQDPVLVGGAAVEFYTAGGYSTRDIDFVAEGGRDLAAAMKNLGFEKIGKDFVDTRRKIYIEFPSRSLKRGEVAVRVIIGSRSLRMISVEDLIVDRLCAYKFWKSEIDGLNALLLLEESELDEARLGERAGMEAVDDALKAVRRVCEEAIRRKLERRAASQLLKAEMKKLAGK